MESNRGKPPLRVALDTTFAGTNPTGVGLYSRRLAELLRIVSEESNLTLRCIGPACRANLSSSLGAIMQEWPIYTQVAVPILLARYPVETVHSTSHIGPLFSTARRIVTVHDLLFMRYPHDYNPVWVAITKGLLPFVLRRSTVIIADSMTTARDIQHFYGTSKRKIKVIYPGFDSPSQLKVDKESSTTLIGSPVEGTPYILCVGPWVGRKNLRVAIAAFERIADRNDNVRLVVTGNQPRGMRGESPDELVRRLPPHVQRRIHLAGHLQSSKLQETIRRASVLAYPSRFEGFGLPPLEAMHFGVPVLASDTRVAHEIYGDAALYAPPDDPDKWADMLERLLSDKGLQLRLKRAGLARSGHFGWERCAKECVALYRLVQ